VFDRENGLPNEVIINTFRFFTAKTSARIARTSQLFSEHSRYRINELIKKIEISPLDVKVLLELEKCCELYSYENFYFLHISTYDIKSPHGKRPDKSILEHHFIKKLSQLRDVSLYFYSLDGVEFYGMENEGSASNGRQTVLYFLTSETDDNKRRCELYFDADLKQVSVLRPGFNFCLGRKPRANELFATFRAAHPIDKRAMLMQLLFNESQLIPLRYRDEPRYLFRSPKLNQYIFIASVGNHPNLDYKVFIGNPDSWQQIPVLSVQYARRDGSSLFELEEASGFETIFTVPWYNKITKRTLTLTNGKVLNLQVFNPRKIDYASIGITIDEPNPRPTLLDCFEENELESKISYSK
jgi:hypothetical protein